MGLIVDEPYIQVTIFLRGRVHKTRDFSDLHAAFAWTLVEIRDQLNVDVIINKFGAKVRRTYFKRIKK